MLMREKPAQGGGLVPLIAGEDQPPDHEDTWSYIILSAPQTNKITSYLHSLVSSMCISLVHVSPSESLMNDAPGWSEAGGRP